MLVPHAVLLEMQAIVFSKRSIKSMYVHGVRLHRTVSMSRKLSVRWRISALHAKMQSVEILYVHITHLLCKLTFWDFGLCVSSDCSLYWPWPLIGCWITDTFKACILVGPLFWRSKSFNNCIVLVYWCILCIDFVFCMQYESSLIINYNYWPNDVVCDFSARWHKSSKIGVYFRVKWL